MYVIIENMNEAHFFNFPNSFFKHKIKLPINYIKHEFIKINMVNINNIQVNCMLL